MARNSILKVYAMSMILSKKISRRLFIQLLSVLPVLGSCLVLTQRSRQTGRNEEYLVVRGWVLKTSDLDIISRRKG